MLRIFRKEYEGNKSRLEANRNFLLVRQKFENGEMLKEKT